MRVFWKVLGIAVALAAVFLAAFAVWGDALERLFSQEALAGWFAESRPWAWAAAIGLLAADLVLPIPATGVFAALGSAYGVALGAAIGTAGSCAAGMAGYGLARLAGRRAGRWLADEDELDRFRGLFDRWGPWAVLISRALPILPEVMAVLAGLAGMRLRRFLPALLLGTAATALLYAWVGDASRETPWWGVLAATAVPLVVWPVFVRLALRGRRAAGKNGP
jgi:uncharacterized membrane protein YdjX (TVP38/TMEM64 family)